MLAYNKLISKSLCAVKVFSTRNLRFVSSTSNLDSLTDNEIFDKVNKKELSIHKLESVLSDPLRAISIRRKYLLDDPERWNNIPSNQWNSTEFFSRVSVCSFFIFLYSGTQL